jgi:hypothetical protein
MQEDQREGKVSCAVWVRMAEMRRVSKERSRMHWRGSNDCGSVT